MSVISVYVWSMESERGEGGKRRSAILRRKRGRYGVMRGRDAREVQTYSIFLGLTLGERGAFFFLLDTGRGRGIVLDCGGMEKGVGGGAVLVESNMYLSELFSLYRRVDVNTLRCM